MDLTGRAPLVGAVLAGAAIAGAAIALGATAPAAQAPSPGPTNAVRLVDDDGPSNSAAPSKDAGSDSDDFPGAAQTAHKGGPPVGGDQFGPPKPGRRPLIAVPGAAPPSTDPDAPLIVAPR